MDIAVDKVTEIILRVRALDVKEGPTDPDSGSNPIDDGATDVLTSSADDATESEIRSMINGLNDDERANLLALLYVGRGDMEAEEWGEAVRFAANAKPLAKAPCARSWARPMPVTSSTKDSPPSASARTSPTRRASRAAAPCHGSAG
jgi:hypothetical protein